MKSRVWIMVVLIISVTCLSFVAITNFLVDPVFHYRRPSDKIHYILQDERYQNDGIQKHFFYNALIVGTSMTENFKTSEADVIFNVNSVKTPYSGGTYKEINDAINTAIEHNDSLKIVIRGLDLELADTDADAMKYSSYPEYLYDDNFFNDINYLLNLEIIFSLTIPTIINSVTGRNATSFDEYANWNGRQVFGQDRVLETYERPEKCIDKIVFSDEEQRIVMENIVRNVSTTIKDNPNIEFYYFITPYSIVYWDGVMRRGELEKNIMVQQLMIKELIQYDNCHLFSWCDNEELVSNLDNYKDAGHYGEWINSNMLNWMKEDVGRLTKENYKKYLSVIKSYYANYDYESLFK